MDQAENTQAASKPQLSERVEQILAEAQTAKSKPARRQMQVEPVSVTVEVTKPPDTKELRPGTLAEIEAGRATLERHRTQAEQARAASGVK